MSANYPVYPGEFTKESWSELIRLLELRDRARPLTPGSVGWSQENITTDRTLDGSTATLTDVINILGTLINDLKTSRVIG